MYRQSSKDNVADHVRAYKNAQQTAQASSGASQKNITSKEKSLSQNQEVLDKIPADIQGNNTFSRKENENQNSGFHHTHHVSQNSSILNPSMMTADHAYVANINNGNSGQRHLSNKSDSNLNQSNSYANGSQKQTDISNSGKAKKDDSEGQKRRKLSEKQVSTC